MIRKKAHQNREEVSRLVALKHQRLEQGEGEKTLRLFNKTSRPNSRRTRGGAKITKSPSACGAQNS